MCAHRLSTVAAVYRQFQLPLPPGGVREAKEDPYERVRAFGAAVATRPSVQRTVVGRGRLIESYSGYADASATSTVAQTLVRGSKL